MFNVDSTSVAGTYDSREQGCVTGKDPHKGAEVVVAGLRGWNLVARGGTKPEDKLVIRDVCLINVGGG